MSASPEWAYDLEIKLIRGEGSCAAGHTIGETWVWEGDGEQLNLGKGMCVHALSSMLPKLVAMRYGANFPWLKDNPDVSTHLCQDAGSPHVFEIRRVKRT